MRSPTTDSAEVVGEAFDVVLAEVVPALDLDEDHGMVAGVVDAVRRPAVNVHRIAGAQLDLLAVHADHRLTGDHVPVLAATTVPLQREALAGVDGDPLHLVVSGVGENFVEPPGAMLFHGGYRSTPPGRQTRRRTLTYHRGVPYIDGTMATTNGDRRDGTLARLSRIEGQVRGVRRMIEEERACAEVLPQLRSVINALCRVQDHVLHQHLRRCVRESFESGGEERDRKTEEIFSLLSRYREP